MLEEEEDSEDVKVHSTPVQVLVLLDFKDMV